jgi:hypothetical protein
MKQKRLIVRSALVYRFVCRAYRFVGKVKLIRSAKPFYFTYKSIKPNNWAIHDKFYDFAKQLILYFYDLHYDSIYLIFKLAFIFIIY